LACSSFLFILLFRSCQPSFSSLFLLIAAPAWIDAGGAVRSCAADWVAGKGAARRRHGTGLWWLHRFFGNLGSSLGSSLIAAKVRQGSSSFGDEATVKATARISGHLFFFYLSNSARAFSFLFAVHGWALGREHGCVENQFEIDLWW
jgi:hypothetical protein